MRRSRERSRSIRIFQLRTILYTNHEVELGRAEEALLRLLKRAQERAGDPELFAGLVQACRYSGMLDAAVAAHERARQLDPGIGTAIAHAYLAQGDADRAASSGASDPPVGALALQLMGRDAEAIDLIRQWEQTRPRGSFSTTSSQRARCWRTTGASA